MLYCHEHLYNEDISLLKYSLYHSSRFLLQGHGWGSEILGLGRGVEHSIATVSVGDRPIFTLSKMILPLGHES
mgnify:CR=1 FL=1